jgi:electron transfer flavoprotein alpha subunit
MQPVDTTMPGTAALSTAALSTAYGPEDEERTILVYLERNDEGGLEDVSLELLGRGREMVHQTDWLLAGLLMGNGVEALAHQAIAYGAQEVWLAEDPLLEHFSVEAYTAVTFQIIQQRKPSAFLLGATPDGRDLAGRVAVRLRTGLDADCTRLWLEESLLVSEVSGFGGGVQALIQMEKHRPQMATVRPGVFASLEPDPLRTGKIIRPPLYLSNVVIRTRILERVRGSGPDLRRTPVLVAGGRGVDGDFVSLQRLADLLGGEVGATRPPVDEGQIERERQIGQTGVVCSPKVAICCGISGAFHFLVGVEKADTIISINSDPEAPMFEFSDYCVVGDTHQILPALIAELQEAVEENAARETAYA